jgi:hypothetical protein
MSSQFASPQCMSTVYPVGEGWIGKSSTGEVRMFQTLDDYKQYLANLSASGRVCPDASVPVAPPESTVKNTPHTGFLEFLPRNQEQQSKFSAMSPGWLGQKATEDALNKGAFAEEEVYFYKAKDIKGGTPAKTPGDDFKLKDRQFPIG